MAARRPLSSSSSQPPGGTPPGGTPPDAPDEPPNEEPLTKLWRTLRGLWRLRSATPELRAKLAARQDELDRVQAAKKDAGERAVRALTENFEEHVSAMVKQEELKNEMRRKLIEEKLSKLEIDQVKLKTNVTGKMLDKWETVLSAGAAPGKPAAKSE